VRVDTQAHTVSTLVPDSLTAPVAGKRRRLPAATTPGRIVVKWTGQYFLVPAKRTLLKNQTQTFTPFARGALPPPPENCGTDPDCLATPGKMTSVPFTNTKPGFQRSWWVDTQMGGDTTVGTIVPTGDIGAQYTAPGTPPDPSTVTV